MAGDWWILCLHQRMRPLWSGLHDTLRPDSLEGGRWAPGWCRCFLIHPVSADCPGLLWALLNSLRLKPSWVVGFVLFSSLLRVVMASIGAAREALSSICLSCLIRPNVWIIACRSYRSGVTGFLVHEFFASKTLCFFSIWKAKCDHTA